MVQSVTIYAARAVLALGISALVVGCASKPTLPRGMQTYNEAKEAQVSIQPVGGSSVAGLLRVDPFANGIRISGTLHGLPRSGEFGFHIRQTGDCGSEGRAAGGIFNPLGSRHGRYATGEHMLGDMDNLEVDTAGQVHLNRSIQGVTLGSGQYNDVANLAVVVHEMADDYATQPDGNVGRPIACGVITVTNPPPAP